MLFTKTITSYQPLPNPTIINYDIFQGDKKGFLAIDFDNKITDVFSVNLVVLAKVIFVLV